MNFIKFFVAGLVGLISVSHACFLWADTPNAGSLQQQMPATINSMSATMIDMPYTGTDGVEMPSSDSFQLTKVSIVGNTLVSTEALLALVEHAEGSTVSLTDLGKLAQHLTNYYKQQGYSLSQAIIPAQVIANGEVTIEVVEARFGAVTLTNQSKVADDLLHATLGSNHQGVMINDEQLYGSLLLMSDIPGLALQSTMSPGKEIGESDLAVVVNDGPTLSGNLSLNQHGDKYTGKQRLAGNLDVNNWFGHGDRIGLTLMSSSGDMDYERLAYDWLVDGKGTRLGLAYSQLDYALGADMATSQSKGSSLVKSVWLRRPLKRSLGENVSLQFNYDIKLLKDHVGSTATKTDRQLRSLSMLVSGDKKNHWLEGDQNQWGMTLTTGELAFTDAAAEAADSAAANTKGGYLKAVLNYSHQHQTSAAGRWLFNLQGQWSNTNLDSSEKLGLGGPASIRGYSTGAVSGDKGYQMTLEYQHGLGNLWGGDVTAMAYMDTGRVTVNYQPWAAITSVNETSLHSLGLGFSWSTRQQTQLLLHFAAPVGKPSSLVTSQPNHSTWLQLNQNF